MIPNLGKFDQAVEHHNEALAREGNDFSNLGSLGQFDQAIGHHNQALSNNQYNEEIYQQRLKIRNELDEEIKQVLDNATDKQFDRFTNDTHMRQKQFLPDKIEKYNITVNILTSLPPEAKRI